MRRPNERDRSAALPLLASALFLLAGCGSSPSAPPSGTGGSGGTGGGTGGGATQAPDEPAETPVWTYRVVNAFPHDPGAFTQGLLFHDGFLYESTGRVGESSVRRVDLVTGDVLAKVDIPRVFAEGLVLVGDELVQLTWKDRIGYRWSLDELEQLGTFTVHGEGWGLANAGDRLLLSNGSARLIEIDPETLQPTAAMDVTDQGRLVRNLNELEFIEGALYANVWQSDRIAKIDPATGDVLAWIDLTGIIDVEPDPRFGQPANVLNGIAWDARARRLFVTGKLWPKLFEIEVLTADGELAPLGLPEGDGEGEGEGAAGE